MTLRNIIFFTALTVALPVAAQTTIPSCIGSWKMTRSSSACENRDTAFNTFWSVYTFYPSGSYSVNDYTIIAVGDTVTQLVQKGNWQLDSMHFVFSNIEDEETGSEFLIHSEINDIILLTDSTLFVKSGGGSCGDELMEFIRSENVIRIDEFLSEALMNLFITRSWNLINVSDSSHQITLREDQPVSVEVTSGETDSTGRTLMSTYEGYLHGVSDSTLRLSVSREEISYVGEGSDMMSQSTNYFFSYKGPERTIDLSDEVTLQFSSPFAYTVNNLTISLASIAMSSALVAAPLVSIRYKEHGFNEGRYFRVAGYSLCALTACLPLSLLTRPKSYTLYNRANSSGGEKWYLSNQ